MKTVLLPVGIWIVLTVIRVGINHYFNLENNEAINLICNLFNCYIAYCLAFKVHAIYACFKLRQIYKRNSRRR